MDWLKNAGAVAASITAIIAMLTVVLFKPLKKAYKLLKNMDEKMLMLIDDVGDIQYDNITRAYEYYMSQGWCPVVKKVKICEMKDSYVKKGRNHIATCFEEKIMALPDHDANAVDKEIAENVYKKLV